MNEDLSQRSVLLVHPGPPSWRQRAVQQKLARRFQELAEEPGSSPLTVVLHTPWGEGSSVHVPQGTRVYSTLELLSSERQQAIDDWALRFSQELSDDDRGLLPNRDGIGFGFLNRLVLINGMHTFRTIEESLRALAERETIESLEILAPDRELAEWIADSVSDLSSEVGAWGPNEPAPLKAVKGLVRRVQARARELISDHPHNRDLFADREVDLDCHTLIVSWTTPMTGMFEPLENAIGPDGGPWVRLQFDSPRAPSIEERPGGEVWHLGPPGVGTPVETPSFYEQASSIREHAKWSDATIANWGTRPTEGLLTVLEIESLYRNTFDDQANHIQDTAHLMDRLNPRVVVVGNDRWWVGQTFTRIAAQRGIPSVCLQDGAAQESPLFRWMSASAIALTSRHLGDLLRAEGVEERRLVVTGQPRYDALVECRTPEAQRRARADLGLDRERMYVLFATQYTQGLDYIQSVSDAILEDPNVHLLLRPHPSGPAEYHETVAERYDESRLSVRSDDSIADLLTACDVLVAQSSTVILEAAILGKPVLSAQFGGMVTLAHVEASGALVVTDARALANEVARMHELWRRGQLDTVRNEAASRVFLGPTDGESSRRVARLLVRLANGEDASGPDVL